jgi:excisionase family DNA binding protein
MSAEWMSLGDVSELLGVHSSTVRSWSNQGVLPVHRTKGGHRRYRRSEIEIWMQSQRSGVPIEPDVVMQNMLRHTRFQISEGHLQEESWYKKLDEDARVQYRMSGRALLQGLISYLNSDNEQAVAEAQALGYEYASRGRRYGLSSVEATNALLFFRNMLIESMLSVYETAAVRSPHAWSDMFRKMNDFSDHILIKILETYEIYGRK